MPYEIEFNQNPLGYKQPNGVVLERVFENQNTQKR